MKKALFLIVISAVIIGSCSKDQRVVNQLEGDWKVTGMTVNGTPADPSDYASITYTFEKCKVKKEECPGSMTEAGKSIPFTYKISEKGTKITFTILGFASTSDIIEHSRKTFKYKYTDVDGTTTTTTETTMEKQ